MRHAGGLALVASATWEAINRKLVRDLFSKYDLAGLSSTIVVRHEMTPAIYEPGTHGSMVSVGDPLMMPVSGGCLPPPLACMPFLCRSALCVCSPWPIPEGSPSALFEPCCDEPTANWVDAFDYDCTQTAP